MDLSQNRLANLRKLIEQEGSVGNLARRLQISPIYIYHVIEGNFSIGDAMARKIEQVFKYKPGQMDEAVAEATDYQIAIPVLNLSQRVTSDVTVTRQKDGKVVAVPRPKLNDKLKSARSKLFILSI